MPLTPPSAASRARAAHVDPSSVPRRVLEDALRDLNLGPSNLSRQSKAHLVDVARRELRGRKGDALAAALSIDVDAAPDPLTAQRP